MALDKGAVQRPQGLDKGAVQTDWSFPADSTTRTRFLPGYGIVSDELLPTVRTRFVPGYGIVVGIASGNQFARPDGDVSTGGWLQTPLWQKIDEATPDDNDYIYSSGSPSSDVCEVSLTDINDPNSSTGHVVRYRYGKDLDQGQVDLTVNLVQGTTIIATWNHTNIPIGFNLAEQTLTGGQADSITDYSNLRLRFTANKP